MHRTLLAVALGLVFFHLTASDGCSQTVQLPEGWSASADGAGTAYMPANLRAGNRFVMTIHPAENLGGRDLMSWFPQRVETDLRQRGVSAKQTTPQRSPQGSVSEMLTFRDQGGQNWMLYYVAAQNAGGLAQFGVAISNLPPASLPMYFTPAGNIFGQSLAMAPIGRAAAGGSADGRSAATAKPTPNTANAPQKFRVAQPGTGIPEAKVEAVLHEGRGTYTVWGFQVYEFIYLLLKDGWEYSDPTVPPEDFDMQASKQAEPQKWHHWKRQDGKYLIQESNSSWTELNANPVLQLPAGSSLNTQLVHMTAFSSGLAGGTVSSQQISFHPNGEFDSGSGFIGGTGALQAAGGFSAGAAAASDRNGTRSSASGAYSGPGSSVVTTSSQQSRGGDGSKFGTYRISGYTLELHYANGQVARVLAFYPFGKPPEIYIGNATFSPPRP